MWFLRTDRAELVYHNSCEGIVYAILSHVWGQANEEDTFQKVQDAARQCEEMEAQRLAEHSQAQYRTVTPIEELQETVSRAIRQSAAESFIRVVPIQTMDVELPQELERLEQVRARSRLRAPNIRC